MKAKLDVDLDPYMILGACNPPLALRALTVEPEVGMLLPCNVVVRVQQGETIIEAMDPEAAMGLVRTPAIREVATQAKQRLVAALASVANA
jgi:uncharacterized protein (DUF302 family)